MMSLTNLRIATYRAVSCLVPIFLISLVALAPAPGFAADAVTSDNVAAKMASASTAADHQAIAAYFRSEEAAAAARIAFHEKMLSAVRQSGGKAFHKHRGHCRNLINASRMEKEAFDDLATDHEMAAKELAQ